MSDLEKTAELIKEDLAALGMKVEIKTFEKGNLNQSVIRPRKYDVLLFGQIINHEPDLFAFWHSSQRKDPGLNVAMYTNGKVDKLLEDASITVNTPERIKKYNELKIEIEKDMPAVFLLVLIHICCGEKVKNFKMESIISLRSLSKRVFMVYRDRKCVENFYKVTR